MRTKSCIRGICLWMILCLVACSGPVRVRKNLEVKPEIFPDYADVTIPPNIAPLNFELEEACDEARAILVCGSERLEVKAGKEARFVIPPSGWKRLLRAASGGDLDVPVQASVNGEGVAYAPFTIRVAKEPVDGWLAYRLIEPGYELWNRMGIYQRNLENYTENAIIENKMSDNNCMNCHSFCMGNPERMLFHMREKNACTLLIDGDKVEKLNTETDQTLSPLVYPSWHPSGKYVAFSVNKTKQAFHMNDRNRVEVFDSASDVVVYDTERHEIVTTPLLFSEGAFETFPTFSPDGRTLYFCSAKARTMPKEYDQVRYDLCAVSFDPATRRFGTTVDTLYKASEIGKSVSFPRVSPDGRFLLCTLSGYGNFSIWHKDADLYMIDLSTRRCYPLEAVNSDDVESYHSWSSDSRWIVFSSRRMDGLYTRPFIAYIDERGEARKPFLLPQKDTDFYFRFMKSYNIPEFITGEVRRRGRALAVKAREDKGIFISPLCYP